MKLQPSQIAEASLSHLGEEVVSLLKGRDFEALAAQYGYALSFGRHPAIAIEEELQSCITKFQASSEHQHPAQPSITVKYFNSNKSNLFALIECVFIASEGCPILAELIVTIKEGEKYVFLEEVSLALNTP